MGGEDDDLVLREAGDEIAEAHALLGVESCRGLVEYQYLRVVYHRLCDAEPLLHAARVRLNLSACVASETDLFEQPHAPLAPVALAEPLERRHVAHEVERGEVRVVAEVLREVAQHGPVLVAHVSRVTPVEQDLPSRGPEHVADHAHKRRLSRTVRTQ